LSDQRDPLRDQTWPSCSALFIFHFLVFFWYLSQGAVLLFCIMPAQKKSVVMAAIGTHAVTMGDEMHAAMRERW
jgi:hypothetical protein